MKLSSRFSLVLALASFGGGLLIQAQVAPGPGGAASGPGSPQTGAPAGQAGPGASGPMGERTPMDTQGSAQTRMDDKKFLKDAALGGMTEVELGKLATQKGSSDAVKQFGQKLSDDHSKANEQLKQVAAKENITIPASLDSKHQSRVDKLSKLSGTDFDRAFIKDEVKDHQKDVSEFQQEAQYGTDPEVKALAAKMLPVLQQHLAEVKDLSKQKTASK